MISAISSVKHANRRVVFLLLQQDAGGRTDMSCRSSVFVMLMLVCCVRSIAAASPPAADCAVSIRIHDYAHIEARQLQYAERQVSDAYTRIGVRLDWRRAVRPSEIEAGRGRWPDDAAFFTIVVLAPEMANKLALPSEVAGYAPITREHGGRVAYVLGGRTRDIAAAGGTDHATVLAAVIAHELAHLLMPARSHSPDGVMRALWNPAEFQRFYRERFSVAEGDSIRKAVVALRGGSPFRVAD
jgi:hypothetical protein